MSLRIVVDTNVFISAIRSRRGASFRLLSLFGTGLFEVNLSVPLVFEYEEVGKRVAGELGMPAVAVDDIMDFICQVSVHREIHFLWRPFLRDVDDDFILELAVEANCDAIVTYKKKDFAGVERFGLRLLTPKEFLEEIGELP